MGSNTIMFPAARMAEGNASLFRLKANALPVKKSHTQVSVEYETRAQQLLKGGLNKQIEVCNIAAEAAFNAFNNYDKQFGFLAKMGLTLEHGETGQMEVESDSSGLAYSIAMFDIWWELLSKNARDREPNK